METECHGLEGSIIDKTLQCEWVVVTRRRKIWEKRLVTAAAPKYGLLAKVSRTTRGMGAPDERRRHNLPVTVSANYASHDSGQFSLLSEPS